MSNNRCPECRGRLSIVDCDTHGPVWVCEQCVWASPDLPEEEDDADSYYEEKAVGRLGVMEAVAWVCGVILFVLAIIGLFRLLSF